VTPAARLAHGIDRLVGAIGGIFAWTVLLLVAVMAANVLLRYLFSVGSVWSQELEWHLFVPICLIGMAFALNQADHVRVDILFVRYPERVKHMIDLMGHVAFVLISGLIIWLSWRYVMQSWNLSEGSANPGGIDHRYLLKAFLPAGFLLFGLQSLSGALHAWSRWRLSLHSPLSRENAAGGA
jgi:TRAP-type mannitol/chloroaromatic compound transport system permease small subunit